MVAKLGLFFFHNSLRLDLWYRAYLNSHEGFGHGPCWSHTNYNCIQLFYCDWPVIFSCLRCSRKAMRLSTCLCFSSWKSPATLKPHQSSIFESQRSLLDCFGCGIGDLTWLVTSFRFLVVFSLNLYIICDKWYKCIYNVLIQTAYMRSTPLSYSFCSCSSWCSTHLLSIVCHRNNKK